MGDGYEEPDEAGNGEEDGGEEEAVIISEPGDGRGGSESAGSSRNLVKNMLDGATWSNEL